MVIGDRDGVQYVKLGYVVVLEALLTSMVVGVLLQMAPASQAALLRWHLRGLNFDLGVRNTNPRSSI